MSLKPINTFAATKSVSRPVNIPEAPVLKELPDYFKKKYPEVAENMNSIASVLNELLIIQRDAADFQQEKT